MVDVLVVAGDFAVAGVVETAEAEEVDVEIAVGVAIEKDGGSVKSRRMAQVSGSSPCIWCYILRMELCDEDSLTTVQQNPATGAQKSPALQ